MATRPISRTVFQRPAEAPMRDPVAAPVGGGVPIAPKSLDPTGLVPVNRAQPLATDNLETQRIMERRLGSMPPSSFSGAGGGFVPLDRGGSPILTPADRMSAVDPVVHTMATPLSAEGAARIAQQANYGGSPTAVASRPTEVNDKLAEIMRRIREKRADGSGLGSDPRSMAEKLARREARWTNRLTDRLGRFEDRISGLPEGSARYAGLQTATDKLRARLAAGYPGANRRGLLGIG